jgi:hypothetical protein
LLGRKEYNVEYKNGSGKLKILYLEILAYNKKLRESKKEGNNFLM